MPTSYRRWLVVPAVLAASALAVLYLFDPATHTAYPSCPLHGVTGFQCASCGGLRAMHQLLRGNIAAAWSVNALAVIVLIAAAAEIACTMLQSGNARRWKIEAAVALVAAMAFTILRNV